MTRVMSRRRGAVTGDQIERIAAGPGDHSTARSPGHGRAPLGVRSSATIERATCGRSVRPTLPP
jgi:hypothetical protein